MAIEADEALGRCAPSGLRSLTPAVRPTKQDEIAGTYVPFYAAVVMALAFPLLAEHPELVPVVAKWIFDEWGHERPGSSLEALKNDLNSKLDPGILPIQMLAVADGVPVGVAILKPHEMRDVFPDRTPWLGSVVVAPLHRCKGVGTALTRQIEALALSRGFTRLYLQTERASGGLYSRLGWQTCDRLPYHGYHANVMSKELYPSVEGQT